MKKRIGILFSILLVLAADLGFILFHANQSAPEGADVVIVLGAKLYGEVPAPSLANRIREAAEYLKRNPEAIVIGTGGQGADEDIAEGEAIRRALLAEGIEEHRILVESRSVSTRENLRYGLALLKERFGEEHDVIRAVLSTNAYHIGRSKLLAKKIAKNLGISVWSFEGLPAETPPTVVLSSYLREMLALPKDVLRNFFEKNKKF